MNKQIKILLLILVLALGFYFIYTRKPWKSFSGDNADFSIADTASVTKIFLANTRGAQVLLTKQNGYWLVNDKIPADMRKIDLLLQTMHDLKMRNPISNNEHNTVINELTAVGIKAEFYDADGLIKTLYVGQATNDKVGTYMMLEGSSTPYVTHIPGFVGYMTPRFPVNPVLWKTKLVFDVPSTDIKRVSVTYPLMPDQSFVIENGTTPTLKTTAGVPVETDVNYLKYYLGSFVQMYSEGFDDKFSAQQQDSISKTVVFCELKVETNSGKTNTLALHIKGLDARTKYRYDNNGNALEFDTEKYYGFANGEPDMMYIQQYNFGRLIKKLAEIKSIKAAQ